MRFDQYGNSIRETIDKVLTLRVEQPEATRSVCRQLIDIGTQHEDSKLLGFAYYYLAEAYFDENKYDKFYKNLVKGLEYQLEVSEASLLARSYNMLGINADNQGNIPAAIDYYLTSLSYSKENGLEYEAGLVTNNIGQIYVMLKEYKTAISYLEKAMVYFNKNKGHAGTLRNLIITETAIATSYLHLGETETAFQWFGRIEQQREQYIEETRYPIVIYCFEALFYNKMGEEAKRDELTDQLIRIMEEIPSIMDVYDDAFQICELLLEAKRYEDLWKVLTRIELLTGQAGITNKQLRVMKYKSEYYQATQNEANYMKVCAEYFLLSEQLEEENRTNAKRAIELRIDLESVNEKQRLMQEENKLLLEKSQRDPLTKLPNRDKLNEYSETALDKAFQNGRSLGVEIFDIDCFKQYNDTYGHQAGDKCLKKIAQLLHGLMDQGIFCARYGGDEFIIIYENMTDAEILKIAHKLREDVMNLNIKHKNSTIGPVVTISQGIRNSVPRDGNKIWDYFYAADMSMYHVKRSAKNEIQLVHRAN